MSVGVGDGDSVFKLLEGAGVAEFVFTTTEGAGEVDDEAGLCESELFALLTWLKSITSFPKPGLRERHHTKAARAANTTTIRISTRKRASLVARSPNDVYL